VSDMYESLVETAQSLIAEYGQPATLRHTASVYNPEAGTSVDTVTETACDVLEQDVNSIAMFAASLKDGSLISESTRFFMLAGAVPAPTDKLVVGATTYIIDAARPLSPGAVAIYYTVRVRA